MTFLLGWLQTGGVLGSLTVILRAWSVLTGTSPSLKAFIYYLSGGVNTGMPGAAERLESGLKS